MEAASLALFAAALLINAGSPGPGIAALVARVISTGFASVLPFILAMWIGEVLWLIAAVMGLGFIAAKFYSLFLVIRYLGIAYLVYLAYKMWTAPVEMQGVSLPTDPSHWRVFWGGMALTLGNPKVLAFYLTLLPSLIEIETITLLGLVELVAVAVAVMMFVDFTWSLFAAWARTWLKSPRAVRIANRASATAMGGAAVVLASRT